MRILFIWDGRSVLPGDRLRAIQQTQKTYPDAKYFVITRLDSFLPGFKVINWDDLMAEMVDGLGLKRIPYNWMNPVTFSDWARFWYLGHHGKTLYLDTDAAMLKPFKFGTKFIHSEGNICLMYSGTKGKHLIGLLRAQAEKYIGQLMPLHNRLESTPIPSEYFSHAE